MNLIAGATLFVAGALALRGANVDALPDYVPEQRVSGCIRSAGSPAMGRLLQAWEAGFSKRQTGVTFSDTLKGTETAGVPVAYGLAEIGLLDRELANPYDWYNMFQRRHYYATVLAVANGSADKPQRTFALAVFVHKDNPIGSLTLRQLDGIYGEARSGAWGTAIAWHAEAARDASGDLRTWGRAGLTGEWAERPIHVYGYPKISTAPDSLTDSQQAPAFFRRVVLDGSNKWNPGLREYPRGDAMIRDLGADRYGIAYTALGYRTAEVRPVALSAANGSPVELSAASVADGRYPLSRSIFIEIDRTPGQPAEPRVREFLRYIFSREGQRIVAEEGDYVPLSAEAAARQRALLDGS